MHSQFTRVVGSIAIVSLLGACAAMEQQLAAARQQMASAPAASGSAAPGSPVTAGDPVANAATPSATPASGGSSQTWCCVNKAFYDCNTATNAMQCIGQPFEISPCTQKCNGADGHLCAMKCMQDYGPNAERGHCERTPSRDRECKD